MSDHYHDDPGHSHVPKNERKIAIAAILTGGFMFAEVIGGVISGSLALIADAGQPDGAPRQQKGCEVGQHMARVCD